MNYRPNEELLALLTNPELREAAGLQLLQQSPSIDDLKALIRNNVQKGAAWTILKEMDAHSSVYLTMMEWCDLKEELTERILQFENLNIHNLAYMMRNGCGNEATSKRFIQLAPDNGRALFALQYTPCSDLIADYFLSKPDDNDTLVYIIRYGTPDYAFFSWDRLINRQPTVSELGRLLDSDYREAAWQLLLEFPVTKKDLHDLVQNTFMNNEAGSERAAAHLLATNPTREDLLCVAGYSVLWKYAWNELLRLGITNDELAELINWTYFKQLPWEQLKKQSPTCQQLQNAINTEWDDGFEELWPEIGALMLTLNPTSEQLKFLILHVPPIRVQAVEQFLQLKISNADREWVGRYK